jgi:hypothetical protein
MSALSACCWPGGEESVNADDGPLNRASIAAPATAAIAPLDPMRKTMFIILLIIPAAPLMMLSASRDHLTPHAPELFPDRIQPRQLALCRHHARRSTAGRVTRVTAASAAS